MNIDPVYVAVYLMIGAFVVSFVDTMFEINWQDSLLARVLAHLTWPLVLCVTIGYALALWIRRNK